MKSNEYKKHSSNLYTTKGEISFLSARKQRIIKKCMKKVNKKTYRYREKAKIDMCMTS